MASINSRIKLLSFGVCVFLLILPAPGLGRKFANDPNMNIIDNPKNAAGIDFSQGVEGPDGLVCVERQKTVDKTEKDQLKECFVQNVTQCYYTYVTEYSDAEQEKCEDFYWKQCKIVFKQRTYNATSRQCKRPLQKICDDSNSNNAPFSSNDENLVCETFFETECNTTDVIPEPGDEPLTVTFCDKIPRKICAPDNCRVVEGMETCVEDTSEQIVDYPVELCDLQPQKHCSVVKVAVPRLVPEKKCRETEKDICSTQLVNPHDIKKTVFIKYCTRKENMDQESAAAPSHGYLPPPPKRYNGGPPATRQNSIPVYGVPTSSYGGPPPPPIPSNQGAPFQNSPYPGGNALRSKRDPVKASSSQWDSSSSSQSGQQHQWKAAEVVPKNMLPAAQRRVGSPAATSDEDLMSMLDDEMYMLPETIVVEETNNSRMPKKNQKKSRGGRMLNLEKEDMDTWTPLSGPKPNY